MEQDEINDYTQTRQIDRVRCEHGQRHVPNSQDSVKNVGKPYNSKSMVLQYYNAGICSQQGTHKSKRVTCVSFCYTNNSKICHMQKHIIVRSKSKKWVNLGVGSSSACKFSAWCIWSTTTSSKRHLKDEFLTKKATLSWFHSVKAFENRRDCRTRFSIHGHILSLILTHHVAARVPALSRLSKRMEILNLLPPPRLV